MFLLKFFIYNVVQCVHPRKIKINKQKLAWFVGYLALSNRNMFKKHISTSFTVSFSAKTFVNYLKAMINKFNILISIYLYWP